MIHSYISNNVLYFLCCSNCVVCLPVCFDLDSIHIEEGASWVKVNTDMTGYYVVHYEDGGWDVINKLLTENHTALSYKDRTHLIHNAFQLVTYVVCRHIFFQILCKKTARIIHH